MFTPRIIVCANILSHRIENRRDGKALNWACPSLGRRLGGLIRVRRAGSSEPNCSAVLFAGLGRGRCTGDGNTVSAPAASCVIGADVKMMTPNRPMAAAEPTPSQRLKVRGFSMRSPRAGSSKVGHDSGSLIDGFLLARYCSPNPHASLGLSGHFVNSFQQQCPLPCGISRLNVSASIAKSHGRNTSNRT